MVAKDYEVRSYRNTKISNSSDLDYDRVVGLDVLSVPSSGFEISIYAQELEVNNKSIRVTCFGTGRIDGVILRREGNASYREEVYNLALNNNIHAEESGDISAMVQESVGISKVLLYFYLHADGNITIELYDDIPEYVDVSNKEGIMKFLSLIQLYGYLPRMLFAGAVVIAYEIKNEEVGFCVESQVGLIKYVFSTEDYSLIRLEQVENEYTQRISELEKKVAALEAKLS